VAPIPRLPIVSVRVLIDAGASVEDPEVAGVASLTTHSLAEGTAHREGAALAEAFERLGASLSVGASWDGIHAATTAMRDRFPSVLRLLAEVVLSPSFPEREVARLRDERLAELLEIRAEPRALADEMFEACLYAQGSRFTLPEAGSTLTVSGLSRGHVLDFYGRHFRPRATTIIVAGHVAADEVVGEVGEALSSWSIEQTNAQSGAPAAGPASPSVHIIHREGAPQTELRLGHIGVSRNHPDYFAIVLMNAILGGLFNSRINLNLRERHAFTYGASSTFEWRRSPGPFVISTAVATDVTSRAIREILTETNLMRSTAPAADELSLAVSYLDGVFPIRFETTEAIASALAALEIFHLPEDYYDTYRAHIRAVTADDVARAAREHLKPELHIVAVGDAERIGPELEALDVGPVEYFDAERSPAARP
jgi:zinc protease